MVHPVFSAVLFAATAILVGIAVAWVPLHCAVGVAGLQLLLIGIAGLALAAGLALLRLVLTAAAAAGVAVVVVVVGALLTPAVGCL